MSKTLGEFGKGRTRRRVGHIHVKINLLKHREKESSIIREQRKLQIEHMVFSRLRRWWVETKLKSLGFR